MNGILHFFLQVYWNGFPQPQWYHIPNITQKYWITISPISLFKASVYIFQPRYRLHPSWRRATQFWVKVYLSQSLLLKSASPPPKSEQPVCCILGCKSAEKWETLLCLALDEGATSHHLPSKHMLICTHLHTSPLSHFEFTAGNETFVKMSSVVIFSLFLLWYFERLMWIVAFVLCIIKVVLYIETCIGTEHHATYSRSSIFIKHIKYNKSWIKSYTVK